MRDDKKGHLDADRLDCITILPPAAVPCNVSLRRRDDSAGFLHLLNHDGLPSVDCENPECVVDAVHDS